MHRIRSLKIADLLFYILISQGLQPVCFENKVLQGCTILDHTLIGGKQLCDSNTIIYKNVQEN